MYRLKTWLVVLLFLGNACNQSGNDSQTGPFVPDPPGSSSPGDAFEVIYALSLPTDVALLFEETGTGFNPELLLPLDRIQFYDDPGQVALLMGALGVDLSYCKLFERSLESAERYQHIELLADKLNLPPEVFEKTALELEQYMNQPDSLTELINHVYGEADQFFRESGQESLSSLSLLGGWLEAMYIGVRIFQDKSVLEMGDRILQQKYALTNLNGLLANHQESLLVRRYMHPLNKLKKAYEQVDIRYAEEGFSMDQEGHSFHASVSEIFYEPATLEAICTMILQVRDELIQ